MVEASRAAAVQALAAAVASEGPARVALAREEAAAFDSS